MPSGGQFSNGSGLRLQTATPGTKDVGNANISGTMLASTFGNNQFALDGTLLIGKRISLKSNYTGPLATSENNIIVGQNLNLTSGSDANNTQACVLIGSNWTFAPASGYGISQSVMIGTACNCVTDILPQHITVIGNAASANGHNVTNATVIGGAASVNVGDSVCIGYLAVVNTSNGVSIGSTSNVTGSGNNIAIGYGARDNGNTNVIVLGPSNVLAVGRNNAVVIGNSAQSDVVIGQYRIGISTGSTVNVNDTNYIAASTDGTVIFTANTAAHTVTLPSAASVPSGYIFRIVDASGSVSGVNSITPNPSGTDTIVGSGAPSITNPYGGVRFMADGVSKWISANNF